MQATVLDLRRNTRSTLAALERNERVTLPNLSSMHFRQTLKDLDVKRLILFTPNHQHSPTCSIPWVLPFRQIPVAVIGRILMFGNGVFRKALVPIGTLLWPVVILETDLNILFRATAKDIQVEGGVSIRRHDRVFFA